MQRTFLALMALAGASASHAQTAAPILSPTARFAQSRGADIYANVCQACHMSDAKGARGAGVYPALAGNPKLGAGDYIAGVVVNGLRGMPQFGTLMSDEQAAEVVNFVRTNFGNAFTDKISAEDVKKARR